MKNDKLVPGLILVLIGAAILLSNFGLLHFHWWNIFHLWPIFLVIGGVNLVFAHNRSPWATVLKIAVVILGIGLLLFGNFGDRHTFWPNSHYSFNSDDNNDDNNKDSDDDDDSDSSKTNVKMTGKSSFTEPYKADIKIARLNISGGGTTYNLSGTTSQLFDAVTKDSNRYNFSTGKQDSVFVMDFKMKDHNGIDFDSDKNRADLSLNTNPEWEINVETGATKLDFDLSKFKVRELKLHGGAAAFDVKLGNPLAMTDVDIQTGVSAVEISIPENAACSIETDSGLSGNDFDGFNKTTDNNYETPGYAAAKNKIHIHMSGGLSDFKVKKY